MKFLFCAGTNIGNEHCVLPRFFPILAERKAGEKTGKMLRGDPERALSEGPGLADNQEGMLKF